MTELEAVKGLKFLGIAYGKEFDQEECQVYYEFLKEYTYDTFRTAVKEIIRKSKFLPKINELCEECELHKNNVKYEVIEFMRRQGYFKTPEEYEKTTTWVGRGIVPEWLQEDINKYYKLMKQDKLEHKPTLLIEETTG